MNETAIRGEGQLDFYEPGENVHQGDEKSGKDQLPYGYIFQENLLYWCKTS